LPSFSNSHFTSDVITHFLTDFTPAKSDVPFFPHRILSVALVISPAFACDHSLIFSAISGFSFKVQLTQST
jgi:hypothetical protein